MTSFRMTGLAVLFAIMTIPDAAARLSVVTTLSQIADPLRQIVGDRASVESLMGEGVDPHLYRPVRSDMLRLARADVIFWNGFHLEAQMAETLERLGQTRTVVSIAEILAEQQLLPWTTDAFDPHIWMDPTLWRVALERAVAILRQLDPPGAPVLNRNAEAYFARLEALDRYAGQAISTIPDSTRLLVTAHDAFGYFGRRYSLEVLGIQGISTESEAGLQAVEQMVATLVDRAVPAVFVETSVSERNIRALIEGAAARGHTVMLGGWLFSDAMGRPGSYEGTYIGMLDHNVTTITRALGGTAPARGLNGTLAHAE